MIFSGNVHGLFPLKNKIGITITNAFEKILDESKCKPNKAWVDKGSEFYTKLNHGKLNLIIKHIFKENLLLLKDLLEP